VRPPRSGGHLLGIVSGAVVPLDYRASTTSWLGAEREPQADDAPDTRRKGPAQLWVTDAFSIAAHNF